MILTMTGGELPECMTPGEEKRKASFFFLSDYRKTGIN